MVYESSGLAHLYLFQNQSALPEGGTIEEALENKNIMVNTSKAFPHRGLGGKRKKALNFQFLTSQFSIKQLC